MRASLVVFAFVALTALAACGGEDSSAPPDEGPAAGESAAPGGAAGPGETPEAAGAAAPGAAGGTSTPASGSGFDFIEISVGTGPSPKKTDTVVVHYHGTFPDGKVFDSSRDRGAPARFPLNRVIPCWTEGLQMMRVGGKANLVCRPEMAYGAMGAPPTIPPNAVLHFEVELIEIAP